MLVTRLVLSAGCGGGSAASPPPPAPAPPASVVVKVNPASQTILLGNTQTFSTTVSNAIDTSVTWAVNGVAGGNSTLGTISPSGVYSAPGDLPSPAAVQITATSGADPSKSATAQVTIASDVGISITPGAANVELGSTLRLRAAIASAGRPDTAVRWSLSGGACPSACGTVDANGNYAAPQVLPAVPGVTVTVTSVADPAKQAIAALTVTSNFTLQLTAPASVSAGATGTLVATLTPVPGSNPNPQLSWSLSGPGCSGSSCGVLSTTTQASGSGATPDAATYTAPTTVPAPNTVTITVTPQADPSKKAQAVVAIGAGISVSLSPSSATLAAGHRATVAAQVSGTTNTGITWAVDGVTGGGGATGQICIVGSNPCQPVTASGPPQVDYVAPGAIPSPNPVTVQATSVADTTRSATSQITVINHVVVSVQPASVTLAPGAVQAFTASVLGASNQNVVWQVQGTGCAASGVCGTIDANGIYRAPAAAPSPSTLQVLAISSDDTPQFATANVTISSAANIQSLHPASVYAGSANGFTLRVDGSGFVTSSPGPGSTLLIGGASRTTSCTTNGECTAPIFASDVAAAGSLSVQAQNPDGSKSNSVSLAVAAPNATDGTVTLTSSAPESGGNNIRVVEPTTAGVDAPGSSVDLNVGALGIFAAATNTCNLAGDPILIPHSASGAATADVCIFSQSGLDASMSYTVSGAGDVSVVAKQPAGLGIIHLTLQVAANAQPGARTLFIQNENLDKTAASGALEVH